MFVESSSDDACWDKHIVVERATLCDSWGKRDRLCWWSKVYHGTISFPLECPFSPTSILMRTPSGKFIPGKSICILSSGGMGSVMKHIKKFAGIPVLLLLQGIGALCSTPGHAMKYTFCLLRVWHTIQRI